MVFFTATLASRLSPVPPSMLALDADTSADDAADAAAAYEDVRSLAVASRASACDEGVAARSPLTLAAKDQMPSRRRAFEPYFTPVRKHATHEATRVRLAHHPPGVVITGGVARTDTLARTGSLAHTGTLASLPALLPQCSSMPDLRELQRRATERASSRRVHAIETSASYARGSSLPELVAAFRHDLQQPLHEPLSPPPRRIGGGALRVGGRHGMMNSRASADSSPSPSPTRQRPSPRGGNKDKGGQGSGKAASGGGKVRLTGRTEGRALRRKDDEAAFTALDVDHSGEVDATELMSYYISQGVKKEDIVVCICEGGMPCGVHVHVHVGWARGCACGRRKRYGCGEGDAYEKGRMRPLSPAPPFLAHCLV